MKVKGSNALIPYPQFWNSWCYYDVITQDTF